MIPYPASTSSSSSSLSLSLTKHHHQKLLFLFLIVLSALLIFVLFSVQQRYGGKNKQQLNIASVYLSSEEEELFLKEYFKRMESSSSSSCDIEENKGTLTREMIGPHVWNVFHAFVQNYKDLDHDKLLNWIHLTADLFPCKQCSNDFKGILTKFPYKGFEKQYKSKERWMCKLHNLVNKKTKKTKLYDCDDEDWLETTYRLQKC